jgi:hypothetical protein
MITIDQQQNLVAIAVLGDFTLGDFKEFENLVNSKLASGSVVNLLFDLRNMLRFTVDVVLEEIRFSRAHPHDFNRIAVLTDSPWVAWTAWLEQAFVAADLRVFSDEGEAREWLAESEE